MLFNKSKVPMPVEYQGMTVEQYKAFVAYTPELTYDLKDIRNFGFYKIKRLEQLLDGKDFYLAPYTNEKEEKVVTPSDWKYYINYYNYRDPFDFDSKKSKIGFFGCSFTFGEGIESEKTFAQLTGKALDMSVFNFGTGGSSIHKIARTFSAVTKFVDLDYAVITLPHWHRQLYLDRENNSLINLIPAYPHQGFETISRNLTALDDTFYMLQATSFVSWMNDVAQSKNIRVLFGSWDHALNGICRAMLPENSIEPFPNIDNACARDKMHPGNKSQEAYADMIVRKFNDRAWI